MSVARAFSDQAKACATLGSPFMERLMTLCAERLDTSNAVGKAILGWQGNPHYSADSVPLRLAGGLHALVLSGADEDLAACYPPNVVSDDALWFAVDQALSRHEAALLGALTSAPQTNEIRRSVALVPALHLIAAQTGLPIRLSELGASAGLNLICDHFGVVAGATRYGPEDAPVVLRPDWSGPAPEPAALMIAERAGVDLNPIEIADPAERLRLLSYLWADQPERVAMTRSAIDIALQVRPRLHRDDAIAWLASRLQDPAEGEAHVVYNTIAWQYFPAESQALGARLLEEAGAKATADRPLFHLSMEGDGGDGGRGAAVTLQSWPGGQTLALARADFHGRWVEWGDGT